MLRVEEARSAHRRHRRALGAGADAGQGVPTRGERVGHAADVLDAAEPVQGALRLFVGIKRGLVVGSSVGVERAAAHDLVEPLQLLPEDHDVLLREVPDLGELGLGVTSGVITQAAPAKAPELKVIATPDQIASHPSVIGAEPELALKDIYGVEQKLSDLRGRVVVLNFWATYCGPCVREMPELVAIQNQYAALGVQVVGASLDTPAERNEVRKFITNLKINFPIWLGATTKDMARFGFGATIPNTAIIGRDGKVVTAPFVVHVR